MKDVGFGTMCILGIIILGIIGMITGTILAYSNDESKVAITLVVVGSNALSALAGIVIGNVTKKDQPKGEIKNEEIPVVAADTSAV